MDELLQPEYQRAYLSIVRGEVDEVHNMLTSSIVIASRISSSLQAEWLIAAVETRESNRSAELLKIMLQAGFDPNAIYDQIGTWLYAIPSDHRSQSRTYRAYGHTGGCRRRSPLAKPLRSQRRH